MNVQTEEFTSQQGETAAEWRNLCYTLEGAQAQNLMDHCSDKYQFAKTYLVYGREEEQTIAEVHKSAQQGNFNFFSERGVSTDHLSVKLTETMMKDWRDSIASKKTSLAKHFQRSFGEDIEVFISTPHNNSRLILAKGYDETDAIVQLALWSHIDADHATFLQIKTDISAMKKQMELMQASLEKLAEQITAAVQK